jgi:sulfatase maturation enzyme AslB (radical SAM superfamily)
MSRRVARVIVERWGRAVFAPPARWQAIAAFRQQHGCRPPWFLVLSPGHACNPACPGCYASLSAGPAKLPWSTLDRIMREAKELWAVPLFVFSGGEPLRYRSQGKDLPDRVEKHADYLFLTFTNGTLIDAPLADEACCRQMLAQAEQNASISREIWEQEYLQTGACHSIPTLAPPKP